MVKRSQLTQETRRGIEMALIRLLARKQYNDITIADIAAEADVSMRTVQRHYGTKDDLLASALHYPQEALRAELADRPEARSAYEDIHNLVAALFAVYAAYRAEMWAAYSRSPEVPELLAALRSAATAWNSAVDDLVARWHGSFRVDPQSAKQTLVALTSYPTWRGFMGAGGFTPSEAEGFVTHLLCRSILGESE